MWMMQWLLPISVTKLLTRAISPRSFPSTDFAPSVRISLISARWCKVRWQWTKLKISSPASRAFRVLQNNCSSSIPLLFMYRPTASSTASPATSVISSSCYLILNPRAHVMNSPGNCGVPRNFFWGGFNKFSWGQRTDRTGIWGR